jgi:hypothetical protein
MKNQQNNPKLNEGEFESETIGNNTMGEKVMIKAQQSGALVYAYPPPEDMCCEICGRKADELEPFDEEFCELYVEYERSVKDLSVNLPCILKYITTDHRLVKNFRSFYQEPAVASWECKNCISLSDEEAIELILEHS